MGFLLGCLSSFNDQLWVPKCVVSRVGVQCDFHDQLCLWLYYVVSYEYFMMDFQLCGAPLVVFIASNGFPKPMHFFLV